AQGRNGRTDHSHRQEGPVRQTVRTEGRMNLLSFFNRRTSAPVARERLQILLAHERGIVGGKPDLVAQLREEILAVVRRHVMVDQDNVQVKMNRDSDISTLEIEIEIPGPRSVAVSA